MWGIKITTLIFGEHVTGIDFFRSNLKISVPKNLGQNLGLLRLIALT